MEYPKTEMPKQIYASLGTDGKKTRAGYWSKSPVMMDAWGKPVNRKMVNPRTQYIRADQAEALARALEMLDQLWGGDDELAKEIEACKKLGFESPVLKVWNAGKAALEEYRK
jgi:hypothetical protein